MKVRIINFLRVRYFFCGGILLLIVSIFCMSIGGSINPFRELLQEEEEVQGEIKTYPVLKSAEQYFDVALDNLRGVRLRFHLPRGQKYSKGELISCRGKIREVTGDYYRALNVAGEIYCKDARLIKAAGSFQQLLNSFRSGFDAFVRRNFPEPRASLLLGMLIGSEESFPADLNSSLRISGLVHIITVSGFNVNFVSEGVLKLSSRIGRKKTILIAFPILWLYLILVGHENLPALRATLMNYYFLGAQLFGVKADYLNGAGISLILILIGNPAASLSFGLYLSYAAVCGAWLLKRPLGYLISDANIRAGIACALGTAPLLFLKSGVVLPWALLVNMLVSPFIALVMEVSIFMMPLVCFFPGLQQFLLLPINGLLNLIVTICTHISRIPLSSMMIAADRRLPVLIVVFTLSVTGFLIVKHRHGTKMV